MTLPIVNTAKYEAKIPSTGQKIFFRPYLVKEEKILYLANESHDSRQKMNAILDVVAGCIIDKIDPKTLTSFDVQYLFLKIRSKSVGEKANIVVKCKECDHENDYTVNLEEIQIEMPKVDNKIQLTDNIRLTMKWPSHTAITRSGAMDDRKSEIDKTLIITGLCIDSIQTETENIMMKDVTEAEILAFLESLNSVQYSKITAFVGAIPVLTHDISFTCVNCNHENVYTLNGVNDFF